MSLGLVGRKVGMTRIFTDDGLSVPVTVLDVSNNRVAQIKTPESDGYTAIQVAFGKRRASRVNKSLAGHLAKAGVEAGVLLKEFPVCSEDLANLKPGDQISVSIFAVGQKVDVTGQHDRQGFSGGIKRHHFSSQRATHGNSVSHNAPGSIGMNQDPGRVFPGKRMAGHLGDVNRTQQNLEIIRVDVERQLLLVKGAVPGLERLGPYCASSCQGGGIMELKLINEQGQESSRLQASDSLFGREYNESLIHQVVVAYQANARSGNRAQKDRGQVAHTTAKPFRQKGTGRARAGMSSSPLWRGGGRIFPNSPDENFSQKLNRKMYRAGMASILSQLVREDRLGCRRYH
jgi:large subunit ribosomal protein L3